METWLFVTASFVSACVAASLVLLVVAIVTSIRGFRESRRGERRLGEIVRLAHLESLQFRRESGAFWERHERRWADHEILMRMILERFDRPGDRPSG